MRTLLALEGHSTFTNYATLSLEEEAVVIAETVADEAAITAELTEVQRASDISESLEDLAVIADNIETATPIEGALFDQAANMAVAGTDVEPTKLIPASESFKGRSLAAESRTLKDRARDIWQQIKEALKRIWARIEAFFYKYFGTLPGLKRDIENMRKKVQASGGNGIEKGKNKFTLTSSLRTLTVNGTVLKNGSDILKAMDVFEPVVLRTFTDDGEAKKYGEMFHDAISNFDSSKPDEQVVLLVNKFQAMTKSAGGVLTNGTDFAKRYPGFDVMQTKPFFNNTSLVARRPSQTFIGPLSPVQTVTQICKTGFFNVQTTDKIPNQPASVEFETLQIAVMDEILNHCFKLVSSVESYQRGKDLKEAMAYKDKLATASEKATAEVARLEISDDTSDRNAVASYRALIGTNTLYCNMLANPTTGLASNVQNVVRTMLSLISKSLAQYA